ncbi:hypothetical protein KI614_06660 [Dechloromonas denitrificans]|uniref:hypothetical protein n=1 Tax=Dechloromonas denitrificans TaxID=281362 RepID=UPI001CF8E9FB|nr:hypothetical protein [Dechloromonas denitrificans]UCV12885.1 hypothetical protein KI614_06660 [Dechloromonas denitrificans]
MDNHPTPNTSLRPLTEAWLVLCLLTVLSLGLGQWFHGAPWLPLLVAAIVWFKGMLVAHRFIESRLAHPFIARVLAIFIAFAPAALILTGFFGAQFARWASL